MKKQLISGLLVSTILLSSVTLPSAQAAIPQAYWQYHTVFQTAKEQNDYAGLIPVSLDIVNLMEQQPEDEDRNSILYNAYEALAQSYQVQMDYNNAIVYLKKQSEFAKKLGFDDAVILAEKRILQIDPLTEVYMLSQDLSTIPYYGAKYEPRAGAYFGRAREEISTPVMSHESATSFYVEFGDEIISQFDYLIRPQDTGTRMLQICLNMPDEHDSLLKVLDGSYDDYLIETMQYLAQLQSPVLLRPGGEMNVWEHSTDPETFKAAYIKIAKVAHQYATNVALVFSPNSISSWGMDVTDFYPGDEYVDWVGMSAYTHQYLDANNPNGSTEFNNMFYNTGEFADSIHGLREIVSLFGDRKPIIISESGSGYEHKYQALNLWNFSNTQLNTLFTYANMVYPQIKTIINFDVNYQGDDYNYSMSAYGDLLNTYQAATNNNGTLLTQYGSQLSKAYIKADQYQDSQETLTFAAHCAPVGQPNMTVTYVLDGNTVGTSSGIPFTCDVATSSLSQGTHGLTVKFQGENGYYEEKHYSLEKGDGNSVRVSESASAVNPNETPDTTPEATPDSTLVYQDVSEDHWAFPYVKFVHENGILQGSNGYFDADGAASRGLTADTLKNLAKGTATSDFSDSFNDVSGSSYEAGINWCVEQGVMAGKGSGSFGTENNLTREEFATTLRAYALKTGTYVEASAETVESLSLFADESSISSWAIPSVAWAVENKLLAGNQGNLNPGGNVTKAEIATIITAYVNQFGA